MRSRILAAGFAIGVTLSAALAHGAESPRGQWLTVRKDPRNEARADVAGRMSSAPREVWRIATGGEVSFVRTVQVGGEEAALVRAGTTLQLFPPKAGRPLWRDLTSGVTSVLHVGDFDGDGRQEALAGTDARTVILLDLATGDRLWSWRCDPSTQILGVAFHQAPSGIRFICFPSYSTTGYCFDFSGDREHPKLLWQKNYEGKYGAGYGPSIVLKDMDGDGRQDIALSGKVPSVYQAVIDADTGDIKFDAHYSVENEWGRPYGLLKVVDLDADGRPDFVMISCQVEEYIAVARNADGKCIEKLWDKFVEKDWPEDHKELRPQVTSLAGLQGNGKIELVVGLWEDDAWHTLVIDPLKGFEAQRGRLKDCYFWGCYDLNGDGRPEIIVSKEKTRRPARHTTVLALDGKTLKPVAVLLSASVFGSGDSLLPEDTAFMALRRNPVYVKGADGRGGILVRKFSNGREAGTFLWGAARGKPVRAHPLAGPDSARADVSEGRLYITNASGCVQRFDRSLRPIGKVLPIQGRIAQPLVWSVGGKRQIVFDNAGGRIRGGTPDLRHTGKLDGQWTVAGAMPALHVDASGVGRIAAADMSDPNHYAALVYTLGASSPGPPLRIPLDYPPYLGLTPYGGEYRLLVNLQTGVHTMALACYDSKGSLIWQDTQMGAHPRIPGAGDLDGDGNEEVAADDHGVLRVYSPMGTVLGTDNGWPPAYTLPILAPFGLDSQMLVLRASGIDGTSLVDGAAKEKWKTLCDRWRYYRSLGAVGDVSGDGGLALGALAEDGAFDCIDTASGKLLWSLELAEPNSTSVVAGDVDGDGRDEFVLGLDDGRLICIGERNGRGTVLWEKRLGAGVANPIIADLDGDATAEIAVSTSDGYVRVFR